ncbi:MAG: Phosphate regulon sensor protein PhoR [Candidatus Izimaplasma bacterium HR2]|nr:MAG: Phosphate regulon sensor protein PhoR [Candidatus Izimaplasma bacterium HR2]
MKMKLNIQKSFIKKIFSSLILLYLIVFILLFIFQGIIFKSFYTNRTIDNTISEISNLVDSITNDNLHEKVIDFSQETQTTTLVLPLSQVQDVTQLSLYVVDIEYGSNIYSIIVPKSDLIEYRIDDTVEATIFLHLTSGDYVPKFLSINGNIIIRPTKGSISSVYSHLIPDLDTTQQLLVSGSILEINETNLVPDTQINPSTQINPIISNEILTIVTDTYPYLTEFEGGNYYISESENTGVSNLVFVADVNIDNEQFILISVFPLNHITDIVNAIQLVNIYIFIIVFIILMSSSFFFSKQFSKPLLFLNKATKELSNLNFDTPLIEINTKDEFSELAQNINSLSLNLKTTLDQLEEQNKQLSLGLERENNNENSRREFISGMSHELKTPLSVIQASAESLEKNIFDNDVDKGKILLLIQKEVQKTNKMINNMLAIYKVDNPDYATDWKELDLAEVTRRIDHNLKLLYTNSNITVNLQLANSIINADLVKIELIINNLFTNAIKYTPKGSKIDIIIKDTKNYAQFEIINYDAQIDKKHIDKLFEAFYRVDKSRSRDEGSTGLGLYIVQQALSQYDSKCIVKNNVDSVSFSFKIKK